MRADQRHQPVCRFVTRGVIYVTILWSLERFFSVSGLLIHYYCATLPNRHPSTVDTHDIMDNSKISQLGLHSLQYISNP